MKICCHQVLETEGRMHLNWAVRHLATLTMLPGLWCWKGLSFSVLSPNSCLYLLLRTVYRRHALALISLSEQTCHSSDHVQLGSSEKRVGLFPQWAKSQLPFHNLSEKKKKSNNPEPVFIKGWSRSLSHGMPHQHSSASILEGCKGLITLVGI